MSKRIKEIDILKGYAMILVILGHLNINNTLRLFIYSFHMPLFFFLSGIVYRTKDITFGSYIKKKINDLIIPYIIIMFINYIAYIILYRQINFANTMKYIFCFNTIDGLPIAGAMWFLTAIFIVYIIAYFVNNKLNKKGHILISIVMFAILGKVCSLLPIRLPLGIDVAMEGFAIFECGYLFNQISILSKIIEFCNTKRGIVIAVMIFLISLFFIYQNGEINFRSLKYGKILIVTWCNFLVLIILQYIICYKLSSNNMKIIQLVSNELIFIGKNTIFFLGFHQLIRYFSYRIVNRVLIGEYILIFGNILNLMIILAALHIFVKVLGKNRFLKKIFRICLD